MNTAIVYTVYKVTNSMNGKFYVGVHKTSNPNDSYLGSGEQIKRAIRKYGRSSFIKQVLHEYDSAAAAYAREAEIVNESFIKDPMTYNMYIGGFGKGIEVANANGLNNKGKSADHYVKMRAAKLATPKQYADEMLIAAFEETKSVRLACKKLGAGPTGGLSRRMRSLLNGIGVEHRSTPGPKRFATTALPSRGTMVTGSRGELPKCQESLLG